MSGRRVTIRDIAERAGVSKSTVAYALKEDSQCAAATRERIQRIAMEMGYVANPLVSAHLANVRRAESKAGYLATLAYLSDRPLKQMLAQGFPHMGAYDGARERANELGYHLEVFHYENPDLSWDRLKGILQSRGIHGVVIGPHRGSKVQLDMEWDCFSTVIIGDSIAYPRFHSVGFDHLGNMELLFSRLFRKKGRRIGLALSGFINRRVRFQFRSAFDFFQEELETDMRVPALISEQWEPAVFLKWYSEYKPEVIVTVYDDVRRWLDSIGVRVPQDVEIATPAIMADSLDYSGIHLPLKTLGKLAVDTVAAQLFRNEKGIPESRCVSLVVGEVRTGKTLREGLV
ncbi:LacI family DNA-binding transcriptional regulator [Pelagicoccus sp. NFK12]|uniref:LacI family DNA-binding transcriptional regulator n=1 Tax=Pelagicoccus enzymogenes TaxID=2773457 RepID=A0A927IHR3_9BACT|nr:LacI family DNA-binding transcriptional regulator [Pelagicoccus enzymogenes]MBD5780074.1 LacI family DNA-binding transcriptional regulator [Pelagicoccus enzymogenes]